MSERYVAFLRAINVGGRRVQKARLTEIFEALGFSGVSTFLASGNVIFDTSASREGLDATIAAHLEEALGYDVPTFLRTMDELQAIAETSAFDEALAQAATRQSPTKCYVALTSDVLDDAQTRSLTTLSSEIDEFFADGAEIYWLRHVDAGESIPTGDVERSLGVDATRRTLNTVQRIVAKFRR